MNVLVTGGSGYLGSHLADALLQAAHSVRVLDLEPAPQGHLQRHGYSYVPGSVTDAALVARALQGVDVVLHLAWSFRAWRDYSEHRPREEREEMQENLLGTAIVLQAALAAGLQHLLFSGSAVVYGPTGTTAATEEQACFPERSALGGRVYGITKWACEKLCLVHGQRGLPVTVFRLHGVFSQDNLGQFGRMIQQARAGQTVTAVRGAGGEYAHLDDVQRAFLLAMANPRAKGEIFNLAGSHRYSEPELARYIVQAAQSQSGAQLMDDPLQGMVSVSVDKLRRCLGFRPQQGEFLTKLIGNALARD
jgi:nucleoside-diphosphate-sugar epimerase